jgi:hypothetical protein
MGLSPDIKRALDVTFQRLLEMGGGSYMTNLSLPFAFSELFEEDYSIRYRINNNLLEISIEQGPWEPATNYLELPDSFFTSDVPGPGATAIEPLTIADLSSTAIVLNSSSATASASGKVKIRNNSGRLQVSENTGSFYSVRSSLIINVRDFGAVGDGVTDDSAAIMAAIASAVSSGGTVQFEPKTYLVNSELLVTSSVILEGAERSGNNYTIIKAGTLGMRSVLALTITGSAPVSISNINFDGSRKSDYAMYIAGTSYSKFENCGFSGALKDGVYSAALGINDQNTWHRCIFSGNGTIFSSTAGGGLESINENYFGNFMTTFTAATCSVVSGQATLTAPSATFQTWGIRPGDPIRIGTVSGGYEVNTVQSIVSETEITMNRLVTTTRNDTGFAIGRGDGFHEQRYGDNNLAWFTQGLFRLNAGFGMLMNGLYGHFMQSVQFDYWGFWALCLGTNGGDPVITAVIDKCYFEANTKPILLVSAQNLRISNCLDKGDLPTSVDNWNGYGLYIGGGKLEEIGSFTNELPTINIGTPWGGGSSHRGPIKVTPGIANISGNALVRNWYSEAGNAFAVVSPSVDTDITTIPSFSSELLYILNAGTANLTLVKGAGLNLSVPRKTIAPGESVLLFYYAPEWKEMGARAVETKGSSVASPGNATINAKVGKSSVANGESVCTITNSHVLADSIVHVTFTQSPGAYHWVNNSSGSFTVNLSSPASGDLAFNWSVER